MQARKKKRLIVSLWLTMVSILCFAQACKCEKKKRLIVSLLFFSLPWFLSPLRGDGKQSWYPFFFCFYVVKTTTSMQAFCFYVVKTTTSMQARKKKRLIVSLWLTMVFFTPTYKKKDTTFEKKRKV